MGYEPLHHKYRPQRFSEVVGQAPIVTTLTNALRTNRIANAYLFTGSRGTGKTTTARLIAKALNCIDGPTPDPCDQCVQCRAIATGTALDVIEIDAASNTGVDNIRELIERAQFAPVQSRSKIYIIDEVHMLSNAAFNCLLKTLEEPPPSVTFVLATTDPQKVLPTVISRCQRFDFRRIPLVDMVEHLSKISWAENIDIEPEALELVAQIAQGGLRDAESLLDQLALLDGIIGAERVWQLVGAVPERELLALSDSIRSADSTALLDQVRRLLDGGKEPLQVLQDLLAFYRDLLIAHTAPDRRDLVAVTLPTWEQMAERARHYTVRQLLALQDRLREAEPQIKGTTQPRLWLEINLLGLMTAGESAPPVQHPTSLPPRPHPIPQSSVSPVTSPAPRPTPPPPAITPPPPATNRPDPEPPFAVPPVASTPPPVVSPVVVTPPPAAQPPVPEPPRPASTPPSGLLRDRWEEWMRLLDPPTQGLVRLSFILRESSKEVVLGFANEPFLKRANDPRRLKVIQETLRQLLGPVQVQFAVGKKPDAPPPNQFAQPPAATPPPTTAAAPPPYAPPAAAYLPPSTVSPTPPPPAPTPPPVAEPDELDRTTRGLAEFFNGEVISWDGETVGETNSTAHKQVVEEVDFDDDDVPF